MSEDQRDIVALHADVVGFSKLMADDRDATTSRMTEFRSHILEAVAAGGGEMVDFAGDSFMAVFDGALEAMRTAISITTEIELRNEDVAPHRQVRFRMGLDGGEVVVADGQFFGDALNISARIQSIAPPGGISVSGRVYKALDEPALRFRAIGQHGLKNIPEETEIYEFSALPTDRSSMGSRNQLSLEEPVVAVLPIHSEMLDETARPIASAVRMDLIHRLARMPQLGVIDATAESGTNLAEGAARYIIETGTHQVGDQVRIYVNLMDVMTMNIVKSHKWTIPLADLFTVSEAFADEVARDIEIELIVGEPAGLYADLDDPGAIEDVYLGWYHLTTGTTNGFNKALSLFEKVSIAHPEQPFGHSLVAFAYWWAATSGAFENVDDAFDKALYSAQTAIEARDPTGMAHMVQAAVLMNKGDTDAAIKAMDEAEILRPTCDATFGLEGSVRRYLGQWDRAIEAEDKAMNLTGRNKPWYPTVKACSLFMGGRADQASSVAEMVLEHQPNNLEALLILAAAQVHLGLERRAAATAEMIRERFPAVDIDAWLDRNPYQDRDLVKNWKTALASAGVLESV